MPHSILVSDLHLIFSTKNRQPFITETVREELWKYIGGILAAHEASPIRIGGASDHIHAFFNQSRIISIGDLVREVKTGLSKWMKGKGCPDFYWQNGYGAFQVCESGYRPVIDYIGRQEEHHRTRSFQDDSGRSSTSITSSTTSDTSGIEKRRYRPVGAHLN